MTESSHTNSAPVVTMNLVSFAYDADPVLVDINVALKANEVVCIVGPNGGGKTTLLRLLLGQLKPSLGTVLVFGQMPERVRHHIGYVPQQTLYDPQFPVSVMDVVLMGRLGPKGLGFYAAKDRQVARQALADVNLAGIEKQPFPELSGGQRQRALIARALVSLPRLLLLDEPTASVDRVAAQQVYKLLANLSHRMTIVFVSHDIGVVSSIVNRVLCVNNHGAVLHETRQITNESLTRLYGGDMSWIQHDPCCLDEEVPHV